MKSQRDPNPSGLKGKKIAVPQKKGRGFWGPPHWTCIHSDAAAYKPEKAVAFKTLMYCLPELLPCEECCANLKKNLAKYPIDGYLRNNHDLFLWTYILHDAVNQEHNHMKPREPPKYSPPFEQVKQFYFKALAEECKACQTP